MVAPLYSWLESSSRHHTDARCISGVPSGFSPLGPTGELVELSRPELVRTQVNPMPVHCNVAWSQRRNVAMTRAVPEVAVRIMAKALRATRNTCFAAEPIPPELGQLGALRGLYLGGNVLSGEAEAGFLSPPFPNKASCLCSTEHLNDVQACLY